jgi:hypothetical protein
MTSRGVIEQKIGHGLHRLGLRSLFIGHPGARFFWILSPGLRIVGAFHVSEPGGFGSGESRFFT